MTVWVITDKLLRMEIITATTEPPKKRRVSHSQFSNWYACRHHWYLDFVKGLRTFEDSINTCFGTAIHEAVQLYIETLYKQGVKEADTHDLNAIFEAAFKRELDDHKVPTTDDERMEFIVDGADILSAFKNMTNRIKYFPTNKYEFIAVEDEIVMPIKNNVDFIGYIDLVLKDKVTGRYRIVDIKTSRMEWKYQKESFAKLSQVLLYKAFFSRKYNVPIEMIDVEFFILKRKLYENYPFPQSRIQQFVPKHTQKLIANTLNVFAEFVTECFKSDGTFVEDPKGYLKNPGKAKKNCKYCVHKGTNCDTKSDIPKEELA